MSAPRVKEQGLQPPAASPEASSPIGRLALNPPGSRMRWAWGLVLLLPVLALACQGSDGGGPSSSPTPTPAPASPTPASPAPGETAEPGEGTPTASTPSPTPTAPPPTGTELPEGFPVYDGATLVSEQGLGPLFIVNYETKDPREQVASFYKEALDQPPWRLVDVKEPEGWPGSLLLFVTRDDPELGGSVSVAQSPTDPETVRIVATYGKRASIFPLPATPTP